MATLFSLALSACGGTGEETAAEEVATEEAVAESRPTADARSANARSRSASDPTLTRTCLAGSWCYDFIDFGPGEERKEVNMDYLFSASGNLQYQGSEMSSELSSGSYSIEGDRIEIKPTLVMFDLVIDEVEEDRFILIAMGGKHHFVRGACAG